MKRGRHLLNSYLILKDFTHLKALFYSILKNKIKAKNQSEINNELYKIYKSLFEENLNTSKEAIFSLLENINLPTLTNEQALKCEAIISKTELLKSLKSMESDKSPGNDGITEEFYEFF